MAKKAFFDERTPAQIKAFRLKPANMQRGLVDRILSLNPATEAVEVMSQIIPGRFQSGGLRPQEIARKAYKHGQYVGLTCADSLDGALHEDRLPNEIREETFDTFLDGKREESIELMGYSFRPVQGRDRRKRVVPFVWVMEGARLAAYALSQTAEGLDAKPYVDARRVETEGGNIVVSVPSREDKKPRYDVRVSSVPVFDNQNKHAISLGFNTTYAEGRVPEHSLWSFGYKGAEDAEQSQQIILYPHDFAAMLGVARHFMIEEQNSVPWDMSVFAKPSREAANFYRLLCNNVLVRDPRTSSKDKLRKLYIPEKSILMARLVGKV